jgi:conjugal transfer pilus assembly protein TraV
MYLRKKYQDIVFVILMGSLFLGLLSALSGCSTFSSSFDCDKVGGIQGCVSMSEVYTQSQAGAFDSVPVSAISPQTLTSGESGESGESSKIGEIGNISKTNSAPLNIVSGSSMTVPAIGQPVRVGDTVQKIMIFDYIDSDGNYNEPSVVYTVLRGANWLNHSVNAVKAMGDE